MKPCFIKFNTEGNKGRITINFNYVTRFYTAEGRPDNATMIVLADGKGIVVSETYEQVEYLLGLLEKGGLDYKGDHK